MVGNALTSQTASKSEQDAVSTRDKTDFRNLDPEQKATIVVVSLGADRISQIYRYLNRQDVEDLTYEAAKMEKTTNSQVGGALDKFYKPRLIHKMMTDGGLDYARSVLRKTFGEITAKSLLKRISKTLQSKPFNFFMKGDPKTLLSFLQHERPQVIALTMSYISPEQAARAPERLPESKQIPTVKGMVKMDRVSPEAIAIVGEEMKRKFATAITNENNIDLGGVDHVADMMNHVNRSNEKRIFDKLDKRNSELSESIRDKMLVSENILDMDDHSVQYFIRDCDTKDIVYVLKSTSDEMQQIFFVNMPKRMVETVHADLEITTSVRMKDAEEAQQRIINIVRRLEDVGEVIVNKGGEDDNIFI